MNTPNKITIARIILIPFIIFFYLAASFIAVGKLIATILFVVAVLTDFLDGYLARKNNQITVLGTFLDSIADKMLVLSSFILIVCDGTILNPLGVISFVIVVSRELIVSAIRQLGASRNKIIAADMWGKIKANFQFFMIMFFMLLSYLLDLSYCTEFVIITIKVIGYVLLLGTVVSTILSGVHYAVKNKEVFKENG